ncbi:uncharacterized protein LOC114519151 isoform X2 [Dendronephthya gigantea]|uniref:uncharacterized protein LOC114519151 isoform X2 n=1 Tax=Dendronephthya gigantea TaxID=151771 RepID=UPI00106A0104|nr:uncharacterized protein LOC114519151 isoform X2 [Dendronephthya gigantea]
MSSIQLFRTSTGRHPYMSRWSRNEPAACRMYLGNCDHWSKLKHRAAILTLKYGDGDTGIAFWSDNEPAENTARSLVTTQRREIVGKIFCAAQLTTGRVKDFGIGFWRSPSLKGANTRLAPGHQC